MTSVLFALRRYAKLQLEPGKAGAASTRASLVELLGVVGEYASELLAYQLHFGVKPCRYPAPSEWQLRDASTAAAQVG